MLSKNKTYIIGIVLSVLMFIQGCDKTWDDHYNTLDKTTEKDKIIAEMEKIPEISSFTAAVKNTEALVDLLEQNRLYTVFAPVNETFDAIDPAILNDEYLFTRMILYHFIDGKFKQKDFTYDMIKTFNTKYLPVYVDSSNKVLLDGYASIINSDNLSQNGIIQVIDKSLIPLNNLYEYLTYNKYSSQFGKAVPHYTTKEFIQSESTPIGKNENNELIYDSVFNITNPFLYSGDERITQVFYEKNVRYQNIADEDWFFAFIYPTNYESALNTAKSSSFLNSSIADYDWAGPILASSIFRYLYSKEEILAYIEDFHANATDFGDSSKVMLYLADLLKNNYSGNNEISNGIVNLVNGFEYDLGWLITDQAFLRAFSSDRYYTSKLTAYQNDLIANATYSDNIDTVIINLNNIKTIFYNDTNLDGYTSKYDEWINFELEGSFYPVDYRILVRGKNYASGTFKIEADGKEIGNYDFSTAPSGDNDTKFNEIGIVSFTETKSVTNLKFTFTGTHPETYTGEQYLWIREIKLSPILK
ncbi:MAG: fasciclin domain-containing protein [Bacteroidales bacterium]|nr:fasciclin domain-containing protein [Bacteroidales bacterium]